METATNQQSFNQERRQTDDSLKLERIKTDDSLEAYIDKKDAGTAKDATINQLEPDKARLKLRSDLELERGATDKNLLGERAIYDRESTRAAELLNSEQKAHLGTKSVLISREDFIAIVSHDLKNPIGAVLSSVEMLLNDKSMMAIGPDARQLLEIIKRNAGTALRLVSDILDMERIVEGKIQLRMAPCRLDDLIQDVIESFTQTARNRKITLQASVLNTASFVSCDRDRVAQVLSNIIGNALKFTPIGGSVVVSTEEVANDVKVTIKDSGPGIPSDQQKRIFERFVQVGSKSRSGLGLGLYISKTLVELHHGKIWVKSSDGIGSEFSFTLPKI